MFDDDREYNFIGESIHCLRSSSAVCVASFTYLLHGLVSECCRSTPCQRVLTMKSIRRDAHLVIVVRCDMAALGECCVRRPLVWIKYAPVFQIAFRNLLAFACVLSRMMQCAVNSRTKIRKQIYRLFHSLYFILFL